MFFKGLSVFLQKLIDLVGMLLNALVAVLPSSPFAIVEDSQFEDFIQKINFFIPIYEFVAIAQAWLVAIIVWYLYAVYARWVNAIE